MAEEEADTETEAVTQDQREALQALFKALMVSQLDESVDLSKVDAQINEVAGAAVDLAISSEEARNTLLPIANAINEAGALGSDGLDLDAEIDYRNGNVPINGVITLLSGLINNRGDLGPIFAAIEAHDFGPNGAVSPNELADLLSLEAFQPLIDQLPEENELRKSVEAARAAAAPTFEFERGQEEALEGIQRAFVAYYNKKHPLTGAVDINIVNTLQEELTRQIAEYNERFAASDTDSPDALSFIPSSENIIGSIVIGRDQTPLLEPEKAGKSFEENPPAIVTEFLKYQSERLAAEHAAARAPAGEGEDATPKMLSPVERAQRAVDEAQAAVTEARETVHSSEPTRGEVVLEEAQRELRYRMAAEQFLNEHATISTTGNNETQLPSMNSGQMGALNALIKEGNLPDNPQLVARYLNEQIEYNQARQEAREAARAEGEGEGEGADVADTAKGSAPATDVATGEPPSTSAAATGALHRAEATATADAAAREAAIDAYLKSLPDDPDPEGRRLKQELVTYGPFDDHATAIDKVTSASARMVRDAEEALEGMDENDHEFTERSEALSRAQRIQEFATDATGGKEQADPPTIAELEERALAGLNGKNPADLQSILVGVVNHWQALVDTQGPTDRAAITGLNAIFRQLNLDPIAELEDNQAITSIASYGGADDIIRAFNQAKDDEEITSDEIARIVVEAHQSLTKMDDDDRQRAEEWLIARGRDAEQATVRFTDVANQTDDVGFNAATAEAHRTALKEAADAVNGVEVTEPTDVEDGEKPEATALRIVAKESREGLDRT